MILALSLVLALGAPRELVARAQDQSVDERRLRRAEQAALEPRFEVALTTDAEGDVRVTLVATQASFRRIVEHIGRSLGRDVLGFEALSRDAAVTTKLDGQALEDALSWIGGSVGLFVRVGPRGIEVQEDLPPYPTRADLYKRANETLWRAILDHPKSTQAPRAAWLRADIEASTSGRALQSARTYDALVDDYPDSDLVPEALLEAGKQYGRADQWETAIDRFDDLASYRTPHRFGVEARRRLAEAHTYVAEAAKNPDVARENARRALLVLDSLDDGAPAIDAAARRDRLVVRARAYSLVGDPLNALRTIDLAATYSAYGDRDPELMQLRANALDRAGQFQDAFLAWLQTAENATDEARGEAYRRAARSANSAGAHLAAHATWKTAENEGLGRFVQGENNRALMSLGLEPEVSTVLGDRDRIAQGERYHASRRYQEAVDMLRPVFDRRFGMDREERQRLSLTYARSLERAQRLDEAIHVLRTSAQEAEFSADRQALYQAASTLYERNNDLERAIAALNGSL
jgi:hypothetical protein